MGVEACPSLKLKKADLQTANVLTDSSSLQEARSLRNPLLALSFFKDVTLHHEVEINRGKDKEGNFIVWMHLDNTNISVALVKESHVARYVQGIGPATASSSPLLKNAKAKNKKR